MRRYCWPAGCWRSCSPRRWSARSGCGGHWKSSWRGCWPHGGIGIGGTRRGGPIIAALLSILAILGCSSNDERLADFARQANEQQARQNEQMAQQSEVVAEASRQLIEADAQARQELIGLQGNLQDQQAEIGAQRDALEQERRDVARQRQRDPIIAAAVTGVGVLVATLAPLLLCWYVLGGLRRHSSDEALVELLVTEFTTGSPVLLLPTDQERTVASGFPLLPEISADEGDDGQA